MSSVVKTDIVYSAPSKVVPLHHTAYEEQVKNTDQGNVAVAKGRARKHPLPASDLAKVPSSVKPNDKEIELEQLFAFGQEQFDALSKEKPEVLAKLRDSLATIQKQLPILAKAVSGQSQTTGSTPSTNSAPSDDTFNAWNQSILMLYTAFSVTQMNQNGQIMNGWEAQQQAQNASLQEAADAEAANAKTSTQTTQACWWKSLLIGLAVAVAVIAVGVVASFVAPVAIPMLAVAAGAVLLGGAAFAAAYIPTNNNPNSSASAPLTETSEDQGKLMSQNTTNTFWSTISQKANNQISTGSQTNLVNASSNDTQLGQQAAQVIQAMGQVMQTPVAH